MNLVFEEIALNVELNQERILVTQLLLYLKCRVQQFLARNSTSLLSTYDQ